MPTLTICRGISGSGKSTWTREQNAIVVSRDSLRTALFGDYATYFQADKDTLREREDYITKVEHEAIRRALLSGRDVISDNTNIEMRFVNAIAKIGYACDAEVVVKVFEVPVPVAVQRVTSRKMAGGLFVPSSVIEQQAARFKPGARLPERPVLKKYTGTPGMPDAFLFDLDGTAYHMGDKRGPYDHNVDVDDPDETVQETVRTLWMGGLVPIAMSGRVEATRGTTESCLTRDDVPFEHLFMRADGDMRSDDVVKHEIFWRDVAPHYNVRFVLDDRDQVVNMWRRIGLKCFQVAPGDF